MMTYERLDTWRGFELMMDNVRICGDLEYDSFVTVSPYKSGATLKFHIGALDKHTAGFCFDVAPREGAIDDGRYMATINVADHDADCISRMESQLKSLVGDDFFWSALHPPREKKWRHSLRVYMDLDTIYELDRKSELIPADFTICRRQARAKLDVELIGLSRYSDDADTMHWTPRFRVARVLVCDKVGVYAKPGIATSIDDTVGVIDQKLLNLDWGGMDGTDAAAAVAVAEAEAEAEAVAKSEADATEAAAEAEVEIKKAGAAAAVATKKTIRIRNDDASSFRDELESIMSDGQSDHYRRRKKKKNTSGRYELKTNTSG